MIERLSQGQVAFGVSNEDLSLENARARPRISTECTSITNTPP